MSTHTQSCVKTVRPASSIIQRPDGFVIECDMPGVSREGIHLTVEKNVLTITGHRNALHLGNPLHRESRGCDYRRAFSLDAEIDFTRINARYEAGVLQILLPHAEAVKPRKIAVS